MTLTGRLYIIEPRPHQQQKKKKKKAKTGRERPLPGNNHGEQLSIGDAFTAMVTASKSLL